LQIASKENPMSAAKVAILCTAIAIGALIAGWVLRDTMGAAGFRGARGSADAAEISFNITGLNDVSPLTKGTLKDDEVERTTYINTMMKLLRAPEFLDSVFQIKEVQDSQWCKGFRTQAAANAALNDAMEIERVPDTTLIRVSLLVKPRAEADILLNKLGEQFIAWTDTIAARQRESDIRAFRDQLSNAEKILLRAQADRDDYRSLHGITAGQVDIAVAALKDLQLQMGKLTLDRAVARETLDSFSADADENKQKSQAASAALDEIDLRLKIVKKLRDEKEAELRKAENDHVGYRSKEEAVSAARAQFDGAQAEFNRQDNILRSQQSRIQFVRRARPI
jgi:hypothetical protein